MKFTNFRSDLARCSWCLLVSYARPFLTAAPRRLRPSRALSAPLGAPPGNTRLGNGRASGRLTRGGSAPRAPGAGPSAWQLAAWLWLQAAGDGG